MMEVKVDPGVQPSCIPLHKFKTLFPHLCRDGLPKEGLLDNTQNEFQSYNGGDMTCYGHFLIDVKDKVTKKYHPIRFYMMSTDVPRILISHAASYWLGLVKVLCDNKAPRIKRQVASIDKKSDFRAKSGHFRTSTPNTASSSQKKQMTSKTVTSDQGALTYHTCMLLSYSVTRSLQQPVMEMHCLRDKTWSFQDANSWPMAKRWSFQQTIREVSNKPIHLRS